MMWDFGVWAEVTVGGSAAAFALGDLVVDRPVSILVGHTLIEVLSVLVAALLLTHRTRRPAGLHDQEDFVLRSRTI